ncbi:MAG: hypothetical protein K1X68_06940 [Saprospiraceae bacterium]|nr:hypothetical protein [Saprospiraceae bacterium]HMW39149.1 hypothetical protein [Saprospiraceae bacterium]HMX88750.1 hypothetical protein [Saprospiraceae bacterium]HMZ38882.1 hypothetical protein [Saprospiraceae bacterium]HNA64488.1 hypothetical protein [Saprospiraceae bacterium]
MKNFIIVMVIVMIWGCAERLQKKNSMQEDKIQNYIEYPSFEYEKQLRYSIMKDTLINRDSLR